jgi:hypothetical protein
MAKFIKFNITNTAAVQPTGPINSILVNVEDITTVTGLGAAAAAKTVVIGLTGRAAQAAAAGNAGGTTLTLLASTSQSAAAVPAFVNGQPNPLVNAVRSAMTSNPGGVATTCSLGNDQAAATVALPNGAQMFWRSATFA